jgi:hypothetical protein
MFTWLNKTPLYNSSMSIRQMTFRQKPVRQTTFRQKPVCQTTFRQMPGSSNDNSSNNFSSKVPVRQTTFRQKRRQTDVKMDTKMDAKMDT